MCIQRKQAECFEDKKKTANGGNVVVHVEFTENYTNVTGTSHKSLCSLCVHRLIIAPMNPLSSSVMMWDMASSLSTASRSLKAKHPRLTASTSFQMVHASSSNSSTCFLFVNQMFLQELDKVSIFAMSYGKGVIEGNGGDTKRVVF